MKSATDWTLAAVIAALAGLFAAMIWPFFLALVMGAILAVLTRPVYDYLVRKRLGPKLSAFITVFLLLIVIAGPLALFVTVAVDQARIFFGTLASQQGGGLSGAALADLIFRHLPFADYVGDPAAFQREMTQLLQGVGHDLGQAVLIRAANLPQMLLHLLIALIACFFVLVQGREFLDWCVTRAPLSEAARHSLVQSFKYSAVSAIWATMAVALAESAIIAAAFLALDIPGVILASGATFILSWIPFVHSAPVSAIAMIYLYAHGQMGRLAAMAVFAVVAGLADNIIRTLVLRGRQGMHPLLALLAILGGIRLFGLLGVFVGPIVAAVLLSLLKVLP